MQTGPSFQRKSSGRVLLPLQAPSHKPSLLSKLTLAPAIRSYSLTAFFTAFISRRLDTKTVISSANAETLAVRRPAKGTQRRAGFALSSLRHRSRGSKARTRTPSNALKRLPFTCTSAWGLWYIMLIHLRNSGLNLAVSKTDAKIRWSTLSKTLDWSKLISVTSVPSSISSRTSRTKCRLSWIGLPFTA